MNNLHTEAAEVALTEMVKPEYLNLQIFIYLYDDILLDVWSKALCS